MQQIKPEHLTPEEKNSLILAYAQMSIKGHLTVHETLMLQMIATKGEQSVTSICRKMFCSLSTTRRVKSSIEKIKLALHGGDTNSFYLILPDDGYLNSPQKDLESKIADYIVNNRQRFQPEFYSENLSRSGEINPLLDARTYFKLLKKKLLEIPTEKDDPKSPIKDCDFINIWGLTKGEEVSWGLRPLSIKGITKEQILESQRNGMPFMVNQEIYSEVVNYVKKFLGEKVINTVKYKYEELFQMEFEEACESFCKNLSTELYGKDYIELTKQKKSIVDSKIKEYTIEKMSEWGDRELFLKGFRPPLFENLDYASLLDWNMEIKDLNLKKSMISKIEEGGLAEAENLCRKYLKEEQSALLKEPEVDSKISLLKTEAWKSEDWEIEEDELAYMDTMIDHHLIIESYQGDIEYYAKNMLTFIESLFESGKTIPNIVEEIDIKFTKKC